MKLDLQPNQFDALFASWLIGPFAGAVELVQSLKQQFRVGCSSNTNEIHIEKLNGQCTLLSEFHDQFLSYEIGFLKPNIEAYKYVIEAWCVDAKNVLFLDDNADNVHAAQEVGMSAIQTEGLSAASAACAGFAPRMQQSNTQGLWWKSLMEKKSAKFVIKLLGSHSIGYVSGPGGDRASVLAGPTLHDGRSKTGASCGARWVLVPHWLRYGPCWRGKGFYSAEGGASGVLRCGP